MSALYRLLRDVPGNHRVQLAKVGLYVGLPAVAAAIFASPFGAWYIRRVSSVGPFVALPSRDHTDMLTGCLALYPLQKQYVRYPAEDINVETRIRMEDALASGDPEMVKSILSENPPELQVHNLDTVALRKQSLKGKKAPSNTS